MKMHVSCALLHSNIHRQLPYSARECCAAYLRRSVVMLRSWAILPRSVVLLIGGLADGPQSSSACAMSWTHTAQHKHGTRSVVLLSVSVPRGDPQKRNAPARIA